MKNALIKTELLLIILSVLTCNSCKKEEVPALTTSSITNILGTSATSGGTITNAGTGTVLVRGVCWSTGTSPTVADNKTQDGSGAGTFSSDMSGLNGATVYYVRAYATNSVGTGYGMAISFTTFGQTPVPTTSATTNITTTSATINGTVNPNYLSTVVTFEYGTTTGYGSTATATQSPVTGSGNSNISVDITGLAPGTVYHFRVKAVNSLGTTYSDDITFTTLGLVPAVTTLAATNISTTSATVNGSVNANYLSTVVTFEYGTSTGYGNLATATQSPVTGYTNTNVNANITGLTAGTTYYYRVKGVNVLGTTYSTQGSFITINIPTITTSAVSLITLISANSGGNVTSDGGATITSRGICWSTSSGPTVSLTTKTSETGTTGSFTSSLTGLTMGTTYYVRAYATNNVGTAYGSEKNFVTQASGTVTDIDGNVNKTITIGNQTWMAENLKVVRFNDGTAIPNVTDGNLWYATTTPSYCWYNNDNAAKNIYGALYNWYTVDQGSNGGKNVCPTGWHVPTDAEWNVLNQYLVNNGFGYNGPIWGSRPEWITKSLASNSGWTISGSLQGACPGWNQADNNSSSFSGLPAGYLISSGFAGLGNVGKWWSAPFNGDGTTWDSEILTDSPYLGRLYESKNSGFSVRCVKD